MQINKHTTKGEIIAALLPRMFSHMMEEAEALCA